MLKYQTHEQPYIPLFNQPAGEKMLKFHSDIASINCPKCSTCLEQFHVLKLHCDGTKCQCCEDGNFDIKIAACMVT